jgi:hypothetical protein
MDRMRFDRQRSEVLGHYEQTYRMALEKHAEGQRYPVRLKQADPLTNGVRRAAARTQAERLGRSRSASVLACTCSALGCSQER